MARRRRSRKNPDTTTLILLGVGVLGAGALAFFLFEKHAEASEGNAALAAGAAAGNAAVANLAVVTTHDPAPAGDLIIREAPSPSADQIGGAEKDGTVQVIRVVDGTWSEIQWNGGPRRAAARGFARSAFLVPV